MKKILLLALLVGVASLLGGFLSQATLALDLAIGTKIDTPSLSKESLFFAQIGCVVTVLLLVIYFKLRLRGFLEILRVVFCCLGLFVASTIASYGVWEYIFLYQMAEEIQDINQDYAGTNQSDLSTTGGGLAASSKLTPETKLVVESNHRIGLLCLKSAMTTSNNRNWIIFEPGVSQLLHICYLLGDEQTRHAVSELASLKGISDSELENTDVSIRSQINRKDSVSKINWTNAINLGYQSSVVPGLKFLELSRNYCDSPIGKSPNIDSASTEFSTSINFNGKWKYKFERSNTRTERFYRSKNDACEASFMHQEFIQKVYHQINSRAEVIGLPNRGDREIVYIILPSQNTELSAFVNSLSEKELHQLLNEGNWAKGTLSLPKVKFDSKDDLTGVLKSLGLTHLFSGNSLPYLSSGNASRVSKLSQRANFELDEDGSRVTLYSTLLTQTSGLKPAEPPPFNMAVNRPFLLVVEDLRTKEFLFLGSIFNPG